MPDFYGAGLGSLLELYHPDLGYLLQLYGGYMGLVILHEVSHGVCLKVFRVGGIRLVIGNFIYINIGCFRLSPLVLSGSTEFDEEDYQQLGLLPRLLIVASGPLSGLAAGLLLRESHPLMGIVAWFMAFVTLFPVPALGTDGGCLVKEIYQHVARASGRDAQR